MKRSEWQAELKRIYMAMSEAERNEDQDTLDAEQENLRILVKTPTEDDEL